MKRHKINSPSFLRIDEKENAIDSLVMTTKFLESVDSDNYRWKWVVIALHNALYGFMICSLTKTNPENVCRGKEGSYGSLIGFWDALKCVQSRDHITGYITAHPIQLSDEQTRSIKVLTELLRNNFEHFRPMGWSIEISGMPDVVISVAEVIENLAFKTGTVFWEEHQSRDIENALKILKRNRG